jgi:DNA polymerase-3 subunit epsilon
MKFAALDLECATSDVGNICEVGLVIFDEGQEVSRFRSLVRPVVEAFGDWQRWNFDYTLADTLRAPSFPKVWAQVQKMVEGIPVVAHNASVVECKHLGHAFSFHEMDAQTAPEFYCTFELAKTQWPDLPKHGIKYVARHFEWKLDHHNPESDARVCASIVQNAVSELGVDSWQALVEAKKLHVFRVPGYQSKLTIASKPSGPRKREDYLHELVTWEPTVPLTEIEAGQRFVLSGFDQAKKAQLRKAGLSCGLMNKRFIKGGVDFLVADDRMGAAKYAKCVEHAIPIVTEAEFKALLNELN